MKIVSAIAVTALVQSSLAANVPFHPVFIEDGKPNANGARFVPASDFHAESAQADQKCVDIQSTISNWYYCFAGGPWGTSCGKGPSSVGGFCVNTNDQAGGALYIGPNPNPGPGSTKFECFFPSSGQAYCDMSLVDGYSLSMNCKANGQTGAIGGGTNLDKTGRSCPAPSGPNCLNKHGYDASQSTVDAFFQAGVQNGNNYCIWKNCNIPNFPVNNQITCTVSGGK